MLNLRLSILFLIEFAFAEYILNVLCWFFAVLGFSICTSSEGTGDLGCSLEGPGAAASRDMFDGLHFPIVDMCVV